MSIFSSILSKLGFGSAQAATTASTPAAPTATPAAAPAAAPAAPAPISAVDVVGQLEALAAKNPEKLNWRVSIVDLMKLLGLDSSFGARKQLATELGCPADKMGDSAQMNMWLHQTVLQKLAANGGNVPKELLH
jgi:3-oxoacyl-ACP reductase-like protein